MEVVKVAGIAAMDRADPLVELAQVLALSQAREMRGAGPMTEASSAASVMLVMRLAGELGAMRVAGRTVVM